jgi:hypothetical protein
MDVLEALQQVHAEQGFLIFNSSFDYDLGEITDRGAGTWKTPEGEVKRAAIDQPFRVVGIATKADFLRQTRKVDGLVGASTVGWRVSHTKFYKVVAAD